MRNAGKKPLVYYYLLLLLMFFFYFSFLDCGRFSDYKLTICDFSANLSTRNANATNIFNVKSV